MTKSLRKKTTCARTMAREIKELVDPEDLLKSLCRLGKEESQWSSQNVIHKPIGLSTQLSKSLESFDTIDETAETGNFLEAKNTLLSRTTSSLVLSSGHSWKYS